MSRDLVLRPSCGGCGSLSDLYGSNCKHMTLCFSCAKSMAQKKAKCSDCGSTLTSLIQKYEVINKCTTLRKECDEQGSYYSSSPHGTTILWMRVGDEIVVGVDSRSIVKCRVSEPNNTREFAVLASETAEKLVQITDGVFASLSGDGTRVNEMVAYVRKEFNRVPAPVRQAICDAVLIRDLAQHYFKKHPIRDPKNQFTSIVYINGWNPQKKKHVISKVGDEVKEALEVNLLCFGSGSGYVVGLSHLNKMMKRNKNMTIAQGVEYMKEALLDSTSKDYCSGGDLKVYSFTRVYEQNRFVLEQKYMGHIMDELMREDSACAKAVFDLKTLFVIFETMYYHIVTPDELFGRLTKFDNVLFISWLGYVGHNKGNQCLLYRVTFSQIKFAVNWFQSCQMWKGSVRRLLLSISNGDSCHCYVGVAGPHLLARVRSMSSFDDLGVIT